MADDTLQPGGAIALVQLRAVQEAKHFRDLYEATGELQDLADAPYLNIAWHAAQCAVRYALPLAGSAERLPKTVNWLGIPYRLIFPPEGPVQIEDPTTGVNLCIGFKNGFDTLKFSRKT
jgi:hypothetical protein